MNPVIDQEREQFISSRLGSNPKRQLLPQWVRPEKELCIVNLPIEWVRFSTLNHRTRAEQMRETTKRGQLELFTEDPLGKIAQDAQFSILSSQEGFEELKNDLRERGQQDPAVVTAEGVLINGNRRSAALRDLYLKDHVQSARYVRAYVLPADASPEEMIDLETELQVAKDYREEYSWVNEALMIEEIFEASKKDWGRVAARMRLKQDKVKMQYDKLQQLHQLVAMSNGTRHHADFVGNESAFEELAKYVRDKPPAEATAVKGVYFLGTLSGVNYRELRHLKRQDAESIVSEEFLHHPTLSSLIGASKPATFDASDDLLDAAIGSQGDGVRTNGVSSLLSLLAQKRADEVVRLPDGNSVSVDNLLTLIKDAMNSAASEAEEEKKDAHAAGAPISRLSKALIELQRGRALLRKARAQPGWDAASFEVCVKQLKEEITKIEALT